MTSRYFILLWLVGFFDLDLHQKAWLGKIVEIRLQNMWKGEKVSVRESITPSMTIFFNIF